LSLLPLLLLLLLLLLLFFASHMPRCVLSPDGWRHPCGVSHWRTHASNTRAHPAGTTG